VLIGVHLWLTCFFARAQGFIHKLKYLLFEIALLLVFVVWLWDKVKHAIGR
jgi:hypothetical protein